jgi:hypothetical protein
MRVTKLLDIPLKPNARKLLEKIQPKIAKAIKQVKSIPVAVLIWGPNIDSASPLGSVRAELRTKLREDGNTAFYSEELYDPTAGVSIRTQELIHAQEFDLIVSTPCTPGSIAEIHDFAVDRRVNAKMLLFLNKEHTDGYSAQSLAAVATVISCHIEYYPNDHETDLI